MIEYFGPGVDKSNFVKPLVKAICGLNASECGTVSWVVQPGETKYGLKEEGCVVVATDGGRVMSFLVGSPNLVEDSCYLMGATVEEFRGQHLYTMIKTKLVENCVSCNACPIKRLVGETKDEKIKNINRRLGFKENGNEFILERKMLLKFS